MWALSGSCTAPSTRPAPESLEPRQEIFPSCFLWLPQGSQVPPAVGPAHRVAVLQRPPPGLRESKAPRAQLLNTPRLQYGLKGVPFRRKMVLLTYEYRIITVTTRMGCVILLTHLKPSAMLTNEPHGAIPPSNGQPAAHMWLLG